MFLAPLFKTSGLTAHVLLKQAGTRWTAIRACRRCRLMERRRSPLRCVPFNPQPSTLTVRPSALNRQPSTLKLQPSTFQLFTCNPQPWTLPHPDFRLAADPSRNSVLNPQRSNLSHHPATLDPQPSTPNLQFSTLNLQSCRSPQPHTHYAADPPLAPALTLVSSQSFLMTPSCSSNEEEHMARYRGTSLKRKRTPLGPYRRPMPRVVRGGP